MILYLIFDKNKPYLQKVSNKIFGLEIQTNQL